MDDQLSQFVLNSSFPCIMAKSVIKKGILKVSYINDLESFKETQRVLKGLYSFVSDYRVNPSGLRSFVVLSGHESFKIFEKKFWNFLSCLNTLDKRSYPHDPRVSSDPAANDFSFSLMAEAFFILALHPESPRLARRFSKPVIVFNLHQQFEDLRKKGIFGKVRNLIRARDKKLQGYANPMLSDFGEQSEIFQYLGKDYTASCDLLLEKEFIWKLSNHDVEQASL